MTDLTFQLTKKRGESLGIGFRKLTKPPHCEVNVLVENGVAATSGLIHPGDILLSVDGVNVQHLNPNEVGGVLARHSADSSTITLEVRRHVANGNMNNTSTEVDSRNEGSLTPDIQPTMDMDSDVDESPDSQAGCTSNGHPTIVVEPHSPPAPDCVSPIVDAPVPETSAIGWNGHQRGGQRSRKVNIMLPQSGLSQIQEATDGDARENVTPHSLNVQGQAEHHRHSLTPEAVRKPLLNMRNSKSLDLANLPQWRAGKNSQQSITMHNLLDGTEMADRLHTNGIQVCGVLFCYAVWVVELITPSLPYSKFVVSSQCSVQLAFCLLAKHVLLALLGGIGNGGCFAQ